MLAICLILFFLVELAFSSSDYNALLELKKGIKKDPTGIVLNTWNLKSLASDGCPKDWHGISCVNGNVESIVLNDAGLVGEFDFKTIANLKTLRNLSVSNNQLSGSILDIAHIESMENLDLSCNMFNGPLPSSFSNLMNVVALNLSTNNFNGVIPSGFRSLKKLKYLDLHSNLLSGDVMNLILELGGVFEVDLSCNKLIGYLDIGLGRSSFISNIKYLNVSHNFLMGELFSHDGIPFFDNLEVFDASNNQLNGTASAFNFVVSLRVLRLGSNRLSGALPEALLQDSSMVLSELDISQNKLEGPVVSVESTSLRRLNLSLNQLSGSLPLKTGQCSMIDLSNNNLFGNISRIKYWGNNLEIIELSSNSLTGTFPSETSQFLRLNSFRVSNNSLQGSLPPILASYPELKIIDLSHNQLSGSFPPGFFSSKKWTDLNLSGNNFSGRIPTPDTDNVLLTLNLSRNSLTGDIPVGISNFHNLLYLDLSSNNLEGSIPRNLSDQLIGFNVSYNNLSGIVPENLRKFPDANFHPGNSLLIIQTSSPFSPGSISNLTSRKGHRVTKRAVIAFIIAGLVSCAVFSVVLFLAIYSKNHMDCSSKESIGKSESKDYYKSGTSSLSPSHKSMEPSLTSPNSGLGVSNPSKMGPNSSEPTRKEGEISSVSAISTHPSPSPPKGQNFFGNFGDKLSGDLHLFDGSLVFNSDQLSRAPAEVIGRSCHGTLYRASLGKCQILVVKRLKEGIAKGRKEFSREVKKLGSVRHPNLVSLQGYYWGPKEHEKLIISNYINAPCLGIYLQGPEVNQLRPLPLEKRVKAATDIARCLNYLHSEIAIPHGNLKSTNILIQSPDSKILITDYSLHRILTPAGTADQVINASALGYLPPEFINSSKPCPSIKSDIYAFGVILLELLTGRSSAEIVSANNGAVDLTDWVKMLVNENRVCDCFEKAGLGSNLTESENRVFENILRIGLRCILPACERPDMGTILDDLSTLEL